MNRREFDTRQAIAFGPHPARTRRRHARIHRPLAALIAAGAITACASETTQAELCESYAAMQQEWFNPSTSDGAFDNSAFDALDDLASKAKQYDSTAVKDDGNRLANLSDGDGGLVVSVSLFEVEQATTNIRTTCGADSGTNAPSVTEEESRYIRNDVITEFVNSGLTQAQAVCLVDTLEAEIGTDRLGERGSLTTEEEAIITEATTTCVLGGE